MACRIPVVPFMAGVFLCVAYVEVEGTGCVDYYFEWWVADDSLGESFWLSDVFYDGEV